MPERRSPALNLNGYTDLPAGKIAAVVTYLELKTRPRLRRLPPQPGRTLDRLTDPVRYRALFRAVGSNWMWFSRLVMSDEALRAVIGHPQVEAFALVQHGRDVGILELDFRPRGECELSFFGLVPEAIGGGAGRYLMNEAIRRAFRRPVRRLFVHTCSIDHPGALAFYMRSGFTPYRRAVEVADDPRLKGLMPPDAAPGVPLIGDLKTARTRPARARPRSGSVRKA